jgi:RHS repeat-associated protein
VTKNEIAFFRGYTGHEMLNDYGLINMNGRLYDPCIGRFLSPDNYVQQPTNSQNFNRYSYCLNNPLKYTDPSGEWFFYSALAGFVRGLIKTVSGRAPWYFPLYKTYKNIANDVKVKFGLLKGSPKQILSRFTWELPQTFVGYEYSNYRLVVSDVEKVRYFDGATYVINKSNSTNDGVTIGSYININTTGTIPTDENGKFAPYKSGLFAHEYGHYLQSQKYGWGYLFSHGLPSLYSAMTSEGEENAYSKHSVFWTERDANNKAYDYFLRHGYLLF